MSSRAILLVLLAAGCAQWVWVFEHPVSVGDSIIGFVSKTRTALATARIVRTEILVENPWKMLGVVAIYTALYFALCRDSPDCPRPSPSAR